MVLTASTMLELGTIAPDFALPNVATGETVSLATFADRPALLVMFICRHCPYVKHIQGELVQLGHDYGDRMGIVGISANNIETHPDDAPDRLQAMVAAEGIVYPICYDETKEVAKTYTAACTPDFFLFDGDRRLVYRGQLDDSRPGNDRPVTGQDLRGAIEAVLAGESVPTEQRPSIGCNIKWKPGNEPAYFG
jgi:peroxiredoxin